MPSFPSRLPIEPLEGRRLCAAVGVQGKYLVVSATAGVSNSITVGLSPDESSVVATVTWTAGKGRAVAARTLTKSFPLTDGFTTIKITGSNKADVILIDQSNGSFPVPTQIHAGGGNDTVTGGDEPDAVWGQGGNDLIVGGGGGDSLFGMSGRDTLIGGDGNDYLSGGTGKDSLEGDAGDDTLFDPYGPDTVIGGDGHDTFNIHSLRADVTNDYNDVNDELHIIPLPKTADDGDPSIGDILGGILPFL